MRPALGFGVLAALAVFAIAGGATASPDQRAVLRIQVNGSGFVSANGVTCRSRCSARFARGRIVKLAATPKRGYRFVGWKGACIGAAPICDLALDRSASVKAAFEGLPVTLELSVGGPGSIELESGHKCGVANPAGCVVGAVIGSELTLTPVPGPDGRFVGWSEPCARAGTGPCTFRVDGTSQVSAAFAHLSPAPATPTLTVGVWGPWGPVTSQPEGIACPSDETCSASFPGGTLVTLTKRSGLWAEACIGEAPECLLVVDRTMRVVVTLPPRRGGVPLGPTRELQVTVSGRGLVRTSNGPINCGRAPALRGLCSENFYVNGRPQLRSLRPRALPGSRFVRWGGFCRKAKRICNVESTTDRETFPVTALFRRR